MSQCLTSGEEERAEMSMPAHPSRPVVDPVLAATRAEIAAYGLRRATMTSVAQRAGISRATLYRRATSLDQLVADALAADFETMLDAALPRDAPVELTRAAIVAAARSMLVQVTENTLTKALVQHDPELLLPYLVDRLGRSQQSVLAGLEAAIALAQQHGSVRDGDPRVLAAGMLQALTSYVIGMRLLESIAAREVWFDEAAHLVDAYLYPERPRSEQE